MLARLALIVWKLPELLYGDVTTASAAAFRPPAASEPPWSPG